LLVIGLTKESIYINKKYIKFGIAIFLAFSPLLCPLPAQADSLSFGVWEGYTIQVSAPEGQYFSNVDTAYYGSPDYNCGQDVTQNIYQYINNLNYLEITASNNIFGDPCPGIYKILEITLSTEPIDIEPPVIIDPTPLPTPTETPTIEPTPIPTVIVDPTPTPTVEPTIEPTIEPTVEPTVKPTIEPTIKPTTEPTPTAIPTPTPTKTTIIIPTPKPSVEPTTEPIINNLLTQEDFNNRKVENNTNILPYTVADAVTEVQAEEVIQTLTDPSAIANAVGEQLQATAQFVGQVFTDPGKAITAVSEAVSKAGLDMTNDQREKAQEVIIPVVIVAQIASVIVGRIK
jgi:hypothetical protein